LIDLCVRGQEVELLWIETLMMALAHYFTSRRAINLPTDVIRRLEAEGHVETEANQLRDITLGLTVFYFGSRA
jgi:hypothetical protein